MELPGGEGESGSGANANAHVAESIIGNVGDVDIMCRIACFMDTGQDLMNLCISVGRRDAAKIRKKYLLKNDFYLVKLLRRLSAIEGMEDDWSIFKDNLHIFDKCRDCVITWMAVNKDWKKRCTPENFQKYKQATLSFDADVIFNNPVVAAEIGVLEVVMFLIESKRFNVNGCFWDHFNSGGFAEGYSNTYRRQHLIHVIMVRGDVELLQYILSVDGFDLKIMIDEDGDTEDLVGYTILLGAMQYVSDECFRCLITHPKVDINHVADDSVFPLLGLVRNYIVTDNTERRRVILSRLHMLLEEGADPRLPMDDDFGQSCIEYVRSELAKSSMRSRWKEVLQVLERAVL